MGKKKTMDSRLRGNDIIKIAEDLLNRIGDAVFEIDSKTHDMGVEIEAVRAKYQACIDAGKKSKDEIYLDVLTSNTQLPLTAMEKAKGVKALLNGLWSPADIAKKTGWSISTVNNLIALYDAPDEISQMVQAGVVSATFATEIVKSNTPDEAVKKLKSAANTAKDAGKKKATKKDLKDATEKTINYKKFGPQMFKVLTDIYECPVSDRGRLQNAIAAAGELLSTLEEEYPALRVENGCGGEEF